MDSLIVGGSIFSSLFVSWAIPCPVFDRFPCSSHFSLIRMDKSIVVSCLPIWSFLTRLSPLSHEQSNYNHSYQHWTLVLMGAWSSGLLLLLIIVIKIYLAIFIDQWIELSSSLIETKATSLILSFLFYNPGFSFVFWSILDQSVEHT